MRAREADLQGSRPRGLDIVFAENHAPKYGDYALSIWEGHMRVGLEMSAIIAADGNCGKIGSAVVTFIDDIGKGFSPSAFGNAFEQEISDGCLKPRKGTPAAVQELAGCY